MQYLANIRYPILSSNFRYKINHFFTTWSPDIISIRVYTRWTILIYPVELFKICKFKAKRQKFYSFKEERSGDLGSL